MKICIGWDKREEAACEVAKASILKHASLPVEIIPISMETLGDLYKRPTSTKDGKLWDDISGAPMSTSHAIARFFVPYLCGYQGWALFIDGDVLIRRDIADLFTWADPKAAVQVVKQLYVPRGVQKKAGDSQLQYRRKNWSSVVLWNCGHPANQALTPEVVNSQRGLWLHEFAWVNDSEVGELPGTWNTLIEDPALVHFTEGLPDIKPGQPYSDEWWEVFKSALQSK